MFIILCSNTCLQPFFISKNTQKFTHPIDNSMKTVYDNTESTKIMLKSNSGGTMLYQKILTGETPYLTFLSSLGQFPEHRHADIELQYCVCGTLEIMIDKKIYQMHAGEIALVSPMSSHAIPKDSAKDCSVLTVIVGASFLKQHFSFFSNSVLPCPILDLQKDGKHERELFTRFEELVEMYRSDPFPNELLVTGILYQICAYLQGLLLEQNALQNQENKQMRKVGNIEKALELIYYCYAEPLRVEDAAEVTGYGKSNFCKIFKSTFGSSFHQALNQQRIQSACILLRETNMSVAEIAQEVGLPEAKSFCRVFKGVMQTTPGQYRKRQK